MSHTIRWQDNLANARLLDIRAAIFYRLIDSARRLPEIARIFFIVFYCTFLTFKISLSVTIIARLPTVRKLTAQVFR